MKTERWFLNGVLIRETRDGVEFSDNAGKTKQQLGIKTPISSKAQAKNFISAIGKALLNPTPVSNEELERRLEICYACEFLKDKTQCLKCGCHVNWKARLETWHCPINKW